MTTGRPAEQLHAYGLSILEVNYKDDKGHLSKKNFIDACQAGLLNMTSLLKKADDLKGLFGGKSQRGADGAPKTATCKDYLAGSCKFGASCRFAHNLGGQGRGGGRGGQFNQQQQQQQQQQRNNNKDGNWFNNGNNDNNGRNRGGAGGGAGGGNGRQGGRF